MNSKSIGLCPQGFESPRCRFASLQRLNSKRAAPGIEPGTSRTLSENHATRPNSQIHNRKTRMRLLSPVWRQVVVAEAGRPSSESCATVPWFPPRHSGVAQWLACWAHSPKVRGSKPRSLCIVTFPNGMQFNAERLHFRIACSLLESTKSCAHILPVGLEPTTYGS